MAVSVAAAWVAAGAGAAAPPDPKALVLSTVPAGFTLAGGRAVTDADVAVSANVELTSVGGWGRIGGYRVELSSPEGRRVRDSASVYATSTGASEALLAEAADASAGLRERTPPVELGQETRFFTSPAGTPAALVRSALAWREGNLDAVISGSGTTIGMLAALAGRQEALLRAAVRSEGAAATTTTTSSPSPAKNDFRPWIPIAIAGVLIAGVAVTRRLRHRSAPPAGS